MRFLGRCRALAVVLVACVPVLVSAQAYQAAVMALNPSHYWQLNETSVGMAVDSAGAVDGTHAGIFASGGFGEVGVPGPGREQDGTGMDLVGLGAGNLAFGAYNAASIDIGPSVDMGNSTMTVATWFQVGIGFPGGSDGGDRIWTNNLNDPNTSFQLTLGAGANLVVGLNPANNNFPLAGLPSGSDVGNFQLSESTVLVKDEQWHHVVASRNGNNIEDVIIVVDGVNYPVETWSDSTDTWGTTSDRAQIATRTPGDGGGSLHVLNGRTDEVAVWLGRQLTIAESIALYNAAIGGGPDCDINGDSNCDATDINLLYDGIAAGSVGGPADIDGSGVVDNDDIDDWASSAGVLAGDANLDGSVGGGDFTTLAANFGRSGADPAASGTYWGDGNFDGNTGGAFNIGGPDFTSLAANFGSSPVAVPEPNCVWALLGLSLLGMRKRLARR